MGPSRRTTWSSAVITAAGDTGKDASQGTSFELGPNVRLNVNGGWLYDGPTKLNYATWGSIVEWTVHPKVALVAEVFGQAGSRGETIPPRNRGFTPACGTRRSPIWT